MGEGFYDRVVKEFKTEEDAIKFLEFYVKEETEEEVVIFNSSNNGKSTSYLKDITR